MKKTFFLFGSKTRRTIDMMFDRSDITLDWRFEVILNIWFPQNIKQ